MKRIRNLFIVICIIALALQLVGCGAKAAEKSEVTEAPAAETVEEIKTEEIPAESPEPEPFRYVHDPRKNPNAMKDIVEDPNAVYGFAPSPDSTRLKSYVDFDWSDEAVVEQGRQERIAYHESLNELYDILRQMRSEGKSIEEMARTVSTERNRIRIESYADNPEGLVKLKESNLETYGREEGPTPDQLYEKYGSWEIVIQKAFGTNPGMDACVGLYDDYYTLYEELGMDK